MERGELVHKIRRVDADFKRCSHRNFQEFNKSSTGPQIARGHGRILYVLRKNADGMNQKKLAELLEIRPQSLTDALEVLEKEGLIIRERSETDRRTVVVKITDSGCNFEEFLRQVRRNTANEVFACLSDEEVQIFAQILDKIHRYNDEREGTEK